MIGVGTRYSDFTTASRTAFQHPDVRFVNLNVAAFDAAKHAGAGAGRRRPGGARGADRGAATATGSTPRTPRERTRARAPTGTQVVDAAYHLGHQPLPGPDRGARRGQRVRRTRATWSCRRPGSMPGDLHMLWRAARPEGLPRRVRLLVHGLRDRRRPGGTGDLVLHGARMASAARRPCPPSRSVQGRRAVLARCSTSSHGSAVRARRPPRRHCPPPPGPREQYRAHVEGGANYKVQGCRRRREAVGMPTTRGHFGAPSPDM